MMMSYEEMFAQGYAFRVEDYMGGYSLDDWEEVQEALEEAEACGDYQYSQIIVDHEAHIVHIEMDDDE